MTDVDLGFNPKQLRDKIGRWARGGLKFKDPKVARDQAANAKARARLARSAVEKKRERELGFGLSNVDLAWSQAARVGAVAARSKRGVATPPRQVAKVMRRQVAGFKAKYGTADPAAIKAKAAQPGHFRAKAIMAAKNGNYKRAAALTQKVGEIHAQRDKIRAAQTNIRRVQQGKAPVAAQHPATTKPTWTKHTKPIPPTPPRAPAPARRPSTSHTSKSFTPQRAKAPARPRRIKPGAAKIVRTGMANKRAGLNPR